MSSEELLQRGYIQDGELEGEPFGLFEFFNLGSTSVNDLRRAGLIWEIPDRVDYPFSVYKPPRHPKFAKPDDVYARRSEAGLIVCAVREVKRPTQFRTDRQITRAQEQALFSGAACGAKVAIVSDTKRNLYLDIGTSLEQGELITINEVRDFNPGVLVDLLTGGESPQKDPSTLAEKVWQAIWHATKQDPKPCLMTFVEIFIFKFLSDNLPKTMLPESYSFYELTRYDSRGFQQRYGETQLGYYVSTIRPKIKAIFPEKTVVTDPFILELFSLGTIVSEPSIEFRHNNDVGQPQWAFPFLNLV